MRKVEAIRMFPVPKNIHELLRFLGMVAFFRRFIICCALRARALNQLTRADVPFRWTLETQKAFDDLKHALTSKPVLQIFSPERETELHTDASARGLAGMLLQRGDDNQFHLVYAVSRTTSDTEAGYHSGKLEMLAIVCF